MREGSVGIVAVGAEFLYPPEGAASLPCRVSETENPFRVLSPYLGDVSSSAFNASFGDKTEVP